MVAFLKPAFLLFWRELPRAVVAGLFLLLSCVPLVVGHVASGPGWMVALATLPPSLALTSVARFCALVARGEGPHLAELRRFDPVLALFIAGCMVLTGFTVVAGALAMIVLPYALAYGALRDKPGLGALRGGAILVAFKPLWALTIVALYWLGGFAAAASTGVLAVVIVPLLLVVTATQTIGLLDEIDTLQSRTWPARR
ncbi:hypothetical protein [Herbidospora mongoliensis]|uniref:hypothetical protein n=1 Tax=Herbidospora mongoliensis TaxID=688067 RepID=UPI000834DEC2|nr:hypothetical protein [Herbidospora mongoliensis]